MRFKFSDEKSQKQITAYYLAQVPAAAARNRENLKKWSQEHADAWMADNIVTSKQQQWSKDSEGK